MNRRFFLFPLVTICLAATAQNPSRTAAAMTDGKFIVNNKEISKDWAMSTLKGSNG